MQCVNGSASWTSWTDKLDGPAGRISWTDQLDGLAGQTSSFYLKPWPVRIFEDLPFSLHIVAASESDEGLVHFGETPESGQNSGQKTSSPISKSSQIRLANPCNQTGKCFQLCQQNHGLRLKNAAYQGSTVQGFANWKFQVRGKLSNPQSLNPEQVHFNVGTPFNPF